MFIQCTLLAIASYLGYAYIWKNRMRTMPGPFQIPLFGNMFQMDPSMPYITLAKWAKSYGPVYKIGLAGEEVVVVTGKEELHEALSQKGTDFANRPLAYRIALGTSNYSDLGFMDYGEKWKLLRKLLHKGLKLHNLARIEEITLDCIQDFIDDVKKTNGQPFDPQDLTQTVILQILAVMIMSTKFEKSNEDLMYLKKADHITARSFSSTGPGLLLDLFPWLRFFGNKTYKDIVYLTENRQRTCAKWRQKIKSGETEGGWLADVVKEYGDGSVLTRNNIDMLVMEFFIGGGATSTSGMYGYMNLMAHYPKVQEMIQKEVDEVLKGKQVTVKDRDNMPYTFACVLELVRYIVPLPLSVPHRTVRDTSLKGHFIPKDTMVFFNLWAQHHDPELWHDPFTFKPERFLHDDGSLVLAGEPPRSYYSPFGSGVRVCPGETLALTRLFLIIVSIAQKFNILPSKDIESQPSCHPKDYILGLVLKPKPFQVRMVPRP